MRCLECNTEAVIKDIKGKSFPYKTHRNVIAQESYGVMTCPQCGEMFLDGEDCEIIDAILKTSLVNSV